VDNPAIGPDLWMKDDARHGFRACSAAMSMHIDLIGRVSVTPPLDAAETGYLQAPARCEPACAGGDPYAAPHPRPEVLGGAVPRRVHGGRYDVQRAQS
jgi:hypothetical protein